MGDPLARSFGRAAVDYERGRPGYENEAVDLLVRELCLSTGVVVLDLGAGTGKLTRILADRFTRVLAVEPDGAMRAMLAELVPTAELLDGCAEEIPLAAASVGGVFVAEAFHWFDSSAAVAEIARVLRPGGGLGLLWNRWELDPPMPRAAIDVLHAVYHRVGRPGGPRYESGAWRGGFVDAPFAELREAQLSSERVVELEDVISLWLSVSSIASVSERERTEIAAALRTQLSGEYRLRVVTDLYWTVRTIV